LSQAPFGIVSLAAGGSEGHPQVRERVKKIKKIIYLYLYIYIYNIYILFSSSILRYCSTGGNYRRFEICQDRLGRNIRGN
jgi:hypothetical protein